MSGAEDTKDMTYSIQPDGFASISTTVAVTMTAALFFFLITQVTAESTAFSHALTCGKIYKYTQTALFFKQS